MDPALETLFYPFETGAIKCAAPLDVLFFNAQGHPALSTIPATRLTLQQYFKPDAAALQAQGQPVTSLPESIAPPYDFALIRAPKSKPETQYLLALAYSALNEGGRLVVSAANDAGGKSLEKMLATLGLADTGHTAKNKCRVVWGTKPPTGNPIIHEWLNSGKMQEIPGGNFTSQPGIYGWNKIDRGSEILAQTLPANLRGNGADFGCGYGYLSRHILETSTPASLLCIDADFRALQCARENLKGFTPDIRYLWEDLTAPAIAANTLDWIAMNPPFHEGKKTDIAIGTAFIKTAAASLRSGGTLYMVANTQLPYEDILARHFKTLTKKHEGAGFKVFEAVK